MVNYLDLDVEIAVERLECIDQDEGDGSEPYVMTVFFKIDGDTVVFNSAALTLTGTATVVATDSGQGDLTDHVRTGQTIKIPAAIGTYRTVLKPIPVRPALGPLTDVLSMMGFLVLVFEEDNTPSDTIKAAYRGAVDELKRQLDALIPQLVPPGGGTLPTPASIQAGLQTKLAALSGNVKQAAEDAALRSGWYNLIATALDPDDQIGQMVRVFTNDDLLRNPIQTIVHSCDQEGHWEIWTRVEAAAKWEIIPGSAPQHLPTHLSPVTDAPRDAWIGAWYGTPPGEERSVLYAAAGSSPSAQGLNITTVDSTVLVPVAASVTDGTPTVQLESAYKRDYWTLNVTFIPHPNPSPGRVRHVNPSASPGGAVARHPNPTPPSGGASAPYLRGRTSAPIPAGIDQVLEVSASSNVRLALYSEIDAAGAHVRYRIRYIRQSNSGSLVQDVMLSQKAVG